jgi:hypothetical protein
MDFTTGKLDGMTVTAIRINFLGVCSEKRPSATDHGGGKGQEKIRWPSFLTGLGGALTHPPSGGWTTSPRSNVSV